jgi:poly(3-hydroxybutyrate) depolymerase
MRALFVPLTLLSIACTSGGVAPGSDADPADLVLPDALTSGVDAGSPSPSTADASGISFEAAARDSATVAVDASPREAATSADVGNGATKPGCKYAANKTGLSSFQQVGGLAFHVYAPTSYDPNVAHTVIVIMAGQDSDGTAEMAALWQPIADSGEPLVLVVPKGSLPATDPTTYPTGANWSVDDLNHIQDLVPEIDDCYDVNVKKHILWGFSEGGFYGYLLGIGAASYFSGLAMGGSNTSFAQENGYPPAAEQWKIPVSHVQGTTDPNGLQGSIQDQADFEAAGSVFTLYQPTQGHTITPAQVLQQYNDLKGSTSP